MKLPSVEETTPGLPRLRKGWLYSTTAGDTVCIRKKRTTEEHPEVWLLEQFQKRSPTYPADWWFVKRHDRIKALTPLRARRGADIKSVDEFLARPHGDPAPSGGRAPVLKPGDGVA